MCVIGRGMGLVDVALAVAYQLLGLGNAEQADDDDDGPTDGLAGVPAGAVVVVGAHDWQREYMLRRARARPPALRPPLRELNAATLPPERAALYRRPGICICTTRVLLVDLLRRTPGSDGAGADPGLLKGVIVLNAHRADGDAPEAFAVRLCREAGRVPPAGGPAAPPPLLGAPRPTPFVGAVVGLTDAATDLAGGFGRAERVMKAIGVRRLCVWPRFRDEVRAALTPGGGGRGAGPGPGGPGGHRFVRGMVLGRRGESGAGAGPSPTVIDVDVEPTRATQAVARAIDDVRARRMAELRTCPLAEAAMGGSREEDLRAEGKGGGSVRPDEAAAVARGGPPAPSASVPSPARLRRLLAPVWHRVPRRARGALEDLATLDSLRTALARLDCVLFLRRLDSVRAAEAISGEGDSGRWMLEDSAYTVFDRAKRRVYGLQGGGVEVEGGDEDNESGRRGAGDGRGGQGGAGRRNGRARGGGGAPPMTTAERAAASARLRVVPVLEEPSIWGVLRRVLGEIQRERATRRRGTSSAPTARGDHPVLVVAGDWHACGNLRAALRPGEGRALLERHWREYMRDRVGDIAVGAPAQGHGRHGGGRGGERVEGPGDGRVTGRGRQGRVDGAKATPRVDLRGALATAELPGEREALTEAATAAVAADSASLGQKRPRAAAATADDDDIAVVGDAPPSLLDEVTFYALESRCPDVVTTVRPSFVILCEADPDMLRALELGAASKQRPDTPPMRVYRLVQADAGYATDAASAASCVERERVAMERLVLSKERLMAPVDAEGRAAVVGRQRDEQAFHAGVLDEARAGARGAYISLNDVSRHGGTGGGGGMGGAAHDVWLAALRGTLGSGPRPARPRVVVDLREFMSPLPGVLHAQGFDVVPTTLTVADYVLSSSQAVERKTLPDLAGSLANGRLYSQATAMCQAYEEPALLIESDGSGRSGQGASFGSLDGPGPLADEGLDPGSSLGAGLALLLLHHPRLRVLWSRGPRHTASLFWDLKVNRDDPDPDAAARVGDPDGGCHVGGGGEGAEGANSVGRTRVGEALLRALPGVSEGGAAALARTAGTVAAALNLDEATLVRCLGSTRQARALTSFLDQRSETGEG